MKSQIMLRSLIPCLTIALLVPTASAEHEGEPQGDAGEQPPVTVCVGSADASQESRCATATLTWDQSYCAGEAPDRTCTKKYTLSLVVGGTCLSCVNPLQPRVLLRGNTSVNIIPAELVVRADAGYGSSDISYTDRYPITDPQGFDLQVNGIVCIEQVDWIGTALPPDCETWSGIIHLPGSNPANGSVTSFAGDMVGYANSFMSWDMVPVSVRVETPPLPPEIPPEVVELIREVAGGGTVRIKVTASDFLDERMADKSNRRLTP